MASRAETPALRPFQASLPPAGDPGVTQLSSSLAGFRSPSTSAETDSEPKQVRGRALVAKVMAATIGELARVGYENLAMEQVAELAGVHKTTLYRRWATKRELTRAALTEVGDSVPGPPDTGSLRQDLLAQLQLFRDLTREPAIQGLMRMLCGGVLHDDIAQYAESIRQAKEEQSLVIYTRACDRGELAPETDFRLLHALAMGAIQNLVLFQHESCDDRRLRQVVDLLLDGALPRGSSPAAPSATRRRPAPGP